MKSTTISIVHTQAQKVLILNTKGGVGKSTLTVNLANKLCLAHQLTEIIDTDPQASSHYWGKSIKGLRSQHANFSYRSYSSIASSIKVSKESRYVLIDTPANLDGAQIKKYLMIADYVVLPIQPSPVDLHASLPLIEKIVVNLRILNKNIKVGFVINRCRDSDASARKVQGLLSNLKAYRTLGRMSETSEYQQPFVTHNLVDHRMDSELWQALFKWLNVESGNVSSFPLNHMLNGIEPAGSRTSKTRAGHRQKRRHFRL